MHNLIWTKEDDDFLRENYLKLGREECSLRLNRTPLSIKFRAGKLKAKKKIKIWSKEENQFIVDNYFQFKQSELANRFGVDIVCIKNKVGRLGLTVKPKDDYTEDEKKIIFERYPALGAIALSKILNRSPHSLRVMSCKLGVKCDSECRSNLLAKNEDISKLTNLNSPEALYFLGYFWADGTVLCNFHEIKFKIIKRDFEHIKHILLPLANWRYSEEHPKNSKNAQSVIKINNKIFKKYLKSFDYHVKSGASASKILSTIPIKLRHYWWRGYFDGDGSVSYSRDKLRKQTNHTNFSITSCVDQNWDFLKGIEDKIKIKFSVYRLRNIKGNEKWNSSSAKLLRQTDIIKFYKYIYSGEQFGLERKKRIFIEIIDYVERQRAKHKNKYRGVSKTRSGKYLMSILVNGKQFRKTFASEIEAAKEYDSIALSKRKNETNLNFDYENI